jgi:hypothetical protein
VYGNDRIQTDGDSLIAKIQKMALPTAIGFLRDVVGYAEPKGEEPATNAIRFTKLFNSELFQ